MPAVHPFRAVCYTTGHDLSRVVSLPYDVLDQSARQALLHPPRGDPRNIVAVDLPHFPPKDLGPPAAYSAAAAALDALKKSCTLRTLDHPAIFAYRQTFRSEDGSRTFYRAGMACCLDLLPLGPRAGGGVLPHEETFSGPKEDRLALMKATRTQLSPIFGLHADDRRQVTQLLQRVMSSRKADHVATTADATLHETWTVADPDLITEFQSALAGEDVFIADGHHRYNTALNYLAELEKQGAVAADHPARRCLFVLFSMADPGLVIWPTHRVLRGMSHYTFAAFAAAAASSMIITPVGGGLHALRSEMVGVTVPPPPLPQSVFGFYDFASRRGYVGTLIKPAPLAARFPDKPRAWQNLDVAIVQHLLVEQICQPMLNAGAPVRWTFPHTLAEIEAMGRQAESGTGEGPSAAQLAIIVRPPPLEAVRDVSRAGLLMPQKSTYFYPKLATGLFMHGLEM